MKRILCFGDSITYGFKPDGSGRYRKHLRYPGRLQALLGAQYQVVEDGVCGRTTGPFEPQMPRRDGYASLRQALRTQAPLDLVALMLGTNDLKTAFSPDAAAIAQRIGTLLDLICQAGVKPLLIAPIRLGERVYEAAFDPQFSLQSIEQSGRLSNLYAQQAQSHGALFLDGACVAQPSQIDQEHPDEAGHAALAEAVFSKISDYFDGQSR